MMLSENENRVAILNLATGVQKVVSITEPESCAATSYHVAVTTSADGCMLLTHMGDVVTILPDSQQASCVAFHPNYPHILAIGDTNGSIHMWDLVNQARISFFTVHVDCVASVRFAHDGRLVSSSWDKTASIIMLDSQFQVLSRLILEGHSAEVTDILPFLHSNQCVTCSSDQTVRVWDCDAGACIRTLTEHTSLVTSLALHPNRRAFASASWDNSVIVRSSETFEILRRIHFNDWLDSLVLGEDDTLFVGVYDQGVVSCDALNGDLRSVVIPASGRVSALALGALCIHAIPLLPHTSMPL